MPAAAAHKLRARLIGLGDVGSQVQSTIRGLQARVDQMLDRAVDWIRRQAASLASRALGGDPNATPQQRLQAGLQEGAAAVNRLSGTRIGIALIRPLLGAIRVRNRMQSLDAVVVDGRWVIRGVVNPTGDQATNKQADGAGAGTPDGSTAAQAIPISWVKPPVPQYLSISLIDPAAVQAAQAGGPAVNAAAAPRVTRTSTQSTALIKGVTIGVTGVSAAFAVGHVFQARAPVTGNSVKDAMNRLLNTHYGYDRNAGAGAPRDNDHVWEKQLGGADAHGNLWPLNESTNRSSGSTVRGEVARARTQLGLPSLAGKYVRLVAPGSGGGGT